MHFWKGWCCVSRNALKQLLLPRAPTTSGSRCVFTHTLNWTFIFITVRDSHQGVAAAGWGDTAAAWSVRRLHPDRTDASCCSWSSRSFTVLRCQFPHQTSQPFKRKKMSASEALAAEDVVEQQCADRDRKKSSLRCHSVFPSKCLQVLAKSTKYLNL